MTDTYAVRCATITLTGACTMCYFVLTNALAMALFMPRVITDRLSTNKSVTWCVHPGHETSSPCQFL